MTVRGTADQTAVEPEDFLAGRHDLTIEEMACWLTSRWKGTRIGMMEAEIIAALLAAEERAAKIADKLERSEGSVAGRRVALEISTRIRAQKPDARDKGGEGAG